MAKSYGQLTKEYREVNDISMRKFARMIGVSKSYLARLEEPGNDVTPSLPILLATAEAMEKEPLPFLKKLGITMDVPQENIKDTKNKAKTITPFTYIPLTQHNLQSALAEGRLMILPFKAIRMGMLVYIPSLEYDMAIAHEVTDVSGGVYACLSETLGRTEFTLFDIGHTVFLSRAEAVRALEERKQRQSERDKLLAKRRRKEAENDAGGLQE